ncbi:MAG: DUF262 domain-containing HNH endonuclease family protein [Nostoc sp.]|uniref:DUF262 domain-containing protein n=1 Tax=Nostoc sp. TaxID=1180 RepID=UPI002FF6E367
MSTIPTIESKNLSISGVFQDFYTVPDFQREYIWKKDNVTKLLEDLFEGLGLYEGELTTNSSEYFLGSIVVCPDSTDDKKTFQLIDGQQRLTTIYLIFCAIRDHIQKLGDKSKAIEDLIMGSTHDVNTGDDIDKYRLSLQYDSYGANVMKCILLGKNIDRSLLQSSQSAKNIDTAWKIIQDFVSENLEDNLKHLKYVFATISNRVKLIRIESPNLSNALKVFETINERGVGLTPVDLLKNYLFIHTAKDTDREKHWLTLKNKWEELLKKLYQNNQQPLQFLRYYIISHYQIDLSNNFPEEEIYDWFLEKGEEYQIQKEPIKFLNDLIIAADHYCQFTQGKNVDGSENIYLKNISKIQGKVRQHFILLLGGRFLEISLFNKLSSYVENLLFAYTITRKARCKDINLTREFAKWGRILKGVKTNDELDSFINKYLKPELESLKEDFKSSLIEISSTNLIKFRLKYILAKITQFVEDQAFGNAKPLDWYLDKSVTIEHILPQSQKDIYSERLGNLTLLEKTINSSISDKYYHDKVSGYRESQIIITRSLAGIPSVGNNTQLNRAMNDLNLVNFTTWDHSSIDKRQQILVNIAIKVWGMEL